MKEWRPECQYFHVVAHTDTAHVFWVSAPDSGYSLDNLAPAQTQTFAAEQNYDPEGLGSARLWSQNSESRRLANRGSLAN